MMAQEDTWQVHSCGSSNWATGDIFEGPKPVPAGRQVGNEKQQTDAGILTHDAMSTAFGNTNWYQGTLWKEASLMFFCSVLFCVFPF